MDDAHAAFEKVRDTFTLSVATHDYPEYYNKLTQLFRSDFGKLDKQGTFDDIVQGKEYGVLEVPYWSWLLKHEEVREELSPLANNEDCRFVWPLLRDSFAFCHALISSREFTITPICPMVDMFPSFSECERRVYMSATVADDSSIVRTFDASIASISKPIAPVSLAGVGERMILVPQFMKGEILVQIPKLLKELVTQVSESSGVVTLTPSTHMAQVWKDLGTIVEGDDVGKCVAELVDGKSHGPFIFYNRYDGIDLPGNACRLLILAGLPKGGNSYDLHRATVFEGSSAINTTIAQRVEQGMGRGTRGAGDHCVVVIVGKELVSWISTSRNLDLMTPITRRQLKMGMDISHGIATPFDLRQTISKCLSRQNDWVEYHAEQVANALSEPSLHKHNLEAAHCERRVFRLARDGYYEKAVGEARKYATDNDDADPKLKGWLLQLAARIAFMWKETKLSEELQQQAYALNRSLLRPRGSLAYTRIASPTKQSQAIVAQIRRYEHKEGFLAYFEEVADWLTVEASSNQFEESLKNLGTILGFNAQRPEEDFRKGPDDLWILEPDTALVIEAKSRKNDTNALTKEEHGQLLEAYQWFKEQYPDMKGYKVAVAPHTGVTKSVTPSDSLVLTIPNLKLLVMQTRQLLTDLCRIPATNATLLANCEGLLKDLALTPKQIIATFLKPLTVSRDSQ